jgi:type II secretory pathway component GspD/PulD (secretin)
VVLLNNQTLMPGGLIQNTRAKSRTGLPFLNRIPALGYLSGSTGEKIEKRELLILMTPRWSARPPSRRGSRSGCAGSLPTPPPSRQECVRLQGLLVLRKPQDPLGQDVPHDL